MKNGRNGNGGRWKIRREQLLLAAGLLLIMSEFINAEIRGGTFHVEFLLVGGALCGISITQWADRK